MAEIPVIGGLFIPDLERFDLLPRVCAALVARERFRREAPGWPALPLHKTDIELLKNDDNPRHNVLALFADCEVSWSGIAGCIRASVSMSAAY